MLHAIRFAAYEREAVYFYEHGYFECVQKASDKTRYAKHTGSISPVSFVYLTACRKLASGLFCLDRPQ